MTALRGIDVRLRLARLFLVTDSRRSAGDLAGFADAVFGAGVDLVQLRDDKASTADRRAALDTLRSAALRTHTLVSVYDDLELARDFGADVLQLPKGRPESVKARRHLHQWAKLGRSCHSEAEVDDALADDQVDFLTVGPVFGGLGLLGRTPGPELVRYAARVADPATKGSKPWFAIGGITVANLDEVLAAGARRVAVGRAIARADEPAAVASEFDRRLRAAWADVTDEVRLDALGAEGRFTGGVADEGPGTLKM